ncbi:MULTISPECIES: hypothetical protein [Marinomonas]|uniref:Uncharacterized protein n=1 Tax=Marinomonas rhodophyticola TaxID=2992803 RepID=A0ABT3KCL0_9GAMM|nr:hypothetical protein [Marinomonas sp. KJ51-3]MCW4628274.1 hypothetical protein [Marinomonas sp. KJ51-3]
MNSENKVENVYTVYYGTEPEARNYYKKCGMYFENPLLVYARNPTEVYQFDRSGKLKLITTEKQETVFVEQNSIFCCIKHPHKDLNLESALARLKDLYEELHTLAPIHLLTQIHFKELQYLYIYVQTNERKVDNDDDYIKVQKWFRELIS